MAAASTCHLLVYRGFDAGNAPVLDAVPAGTVPPARSFAASMVGRKAGIGWFRHRFLQHRAVGTRKRTETLEELIHPAVKNRKFEMVVARLIRIRFQLLGVHTKLVDDRKNKLFLVERVLQPKVDGRTLQAHYDLRDHYTKN